MADSLDVEKVVDRFVTSLERIMMPGEGVGVVLPRRNWINTVNPSNAPCTTNERVNYSVTWDFSHVFYSLNKFRSCQFPFLV